MTTAPQIDLAQLANEVGLPQPKTGRALALLDDGNTIAFITRYRKDQTGGLDEEQIRQIQTAAQRLRQLAERKEAIRRSIEAQGKLTPKLARSIERASSVRALEDLYLPYKPRKQTLATVARERGLEPLAEEIWTADPAAADRVQRAADFVAADKGLPTTVEVLEGVGYLLAERFGDQGELRARLRTMLRKTGVLICGRAETSARAAAADGANDSATSESGSPTDSAPTQNTASVEPASPQPARKRSRSAKKKKSKADRMESAFRDYFDYREAVQVIPPHRILAINRGERAKILKVRVEIDRARGLAAAEELLVPAEHPHADFLRHNLGDALDRLVLPSLERELRRELAEKAEEHAVRVFAQNLRKLLLQPPVRGKPVMALDPGFRSGCKVAILDAFGNVRHHDLLHLVGSDAVKQQSREKLVQLIREYEILLVAIGNGTACRETEQLVAGVIGEELQDRSVAYVIVNEAGASVYSTSQLGREELPELDPVIRSAVSIGRRLLDPLSELVKIAPANLGVGMYQHDIKTKHLQESLDSVVESSVNFVGVDLNTASPALLSYVSGLNQLTARRVYEHRCQHGPFHNRRQLLDVPGIGEASFVQAAGFLKITDGENPLDATWVHPESYPVAVRLLEQLGSSVDELATCLQSQAANASITELTQRAETETLATFAQEEGIGDWLLADLRAALGRPGRDPRDDFSPPMFRTGILKLEDLKVGMELTGTVLNVVDFGAFVDIGISDSALIHISQLAGRFVKDPHEVVSVGDVVRVWVQSIDRDRRRVSLTAVSPDAPDVRVDRPQAVSRRKPKSAASTAKAGRAVKGRAAKPRGGRRPPPKPVTPLTKEMAEGNEPLRSFSDLAQFYEQKQTDSDASTESQGEQDSQAQES